MFTPKSYRGHILTEGIVFQSHHFSGGKLVKLSFNGHISRTCRDEISRFIILKWFFFWAVVCHTIRDHVRSARLIVPHWRTKILQPNCWVAVWCSPSILGSCSWYWLSLTAPHVSQLYICYIFFRYSLHITHHDPREHVFFSPCARLTSRSSYHCDPVQFGGTQANRWWGWRGGKFWRPHFWMESRHHKSTAKSAGKAGFQTWDGWSWALRPWDFPVGFSGEITGDVKWTIVFTWKRYCVRCGLVRKASRDGKKNPKTSMKKNTKISIKPLHSPKLTARPMIRVAFPKGQDRLPFPPFFRGQVKLRLGVLHENGQQKLRGVLLDFANLIPDMMPETGPLDSSQLLDGHHFTTSPLKREVSVILQLLGVWNAGGSGW